MYLWEEDIKPDNARKQARKQESMPAIWQHACNQGKKKANKHIQRKQTRKIKNQARNFQDNLQLQNQEASKPRARIQVSKEASKSNCRNA